MSDDAERLTAFLLDLYALTSTTASGEFSRHALDLLKRTLPFDSGVWGTFTLTPSGPKAHSRFLYNLPDRMLSEYEQVKQHDIVNQQAVASCGQTLNVQLAQAESIAHPSILAHARRWGMEHTLATMVHESPIHLYTAVCLYRNEVNTPFSESDRRFKEAVVPHLVQAGHLSAIQVLDPPPRVLGVPRARALVDRFGVIHNAEPGFAALLELEVPGWQGPSLPPALVSVLEADAADDVDYRGEAVVLSCLRRLPDHRLVVRVRARASIDGLSRRELMVAREFASGKNYRQIAKQFGTSPTTVRSQLQMVYTKLGVRTKVHLIKTLETCFGR
jgi:DNA-binding CsgD family transcriptional regulator